MSEFGEYLNGVQADVDSELDRLLPGEDETPALLHRAMRYSVLAGGKRVRPALVVMAGEALDAPRSELLPGAAAIEMLHTFSLIHDDLPALDDDELRRGRPTVHMQFDEATAVLAGDALLNLGLLVLASQPESAGAEVRRAAVAVVAEAIGTRGMIGGQMSDLEAERLAAGKRDPAEAAALLESIHRRKTGALLTASIRLGGLYAGATAAVDETLEDIGERIGLMFQIADDILDVEGSEGAMGKRVGKDADARKLTYPGVFGLAESKRMLGDVRDEALSLTERLPRNGGMIPKLVEFLHSRDH